ncbi:hypothetical protein ACFO9Q_06685 [Paenibacillus sp. GCM10023252]|uniref:hypothetical protein n=1 Tax=Paenibacillus sp. GCM10023252 TaxID=3252649 RepID=UPI00361F8A12
MNAKSRITFRFDQEGEAKQQQTPLNKESQLKPSEAPVKGAPLYGEEPSYTSEISPWNSPFQDDVHALEQYIRKTDERAPAAPSLPPMPMPMPVLSAERTTPKSLRAVEELSPAADSAYAASAGPAVSAPERFAGPLGREHEHKHEHKHEHEPLIYLVEENSPHHPFDEYRLEEDLGEGKGGGLFDVSDSSRYTARKPSRGPSWMNVFLSVSGALATGAVFGYLLLSLFTGPSIWSPDQSNPDAAPVIGNEDKPAGNLGPVVQQPDEVVQGEGTAEGGTAADWAQVAVPGVSYQLLQYGVFSNQEGRDSALAGLREQGYAAAWLEAGNDYHVYAGMAEDRSRAMALSHQLEGMEVYVKQVDLPALRALPYEGDAKLLSAFLNETNELIAMLSELALTQLEQPSLTPIGQAAAESWKSKHQKWTQDVEAAIKGLKDEAQRDAATKLTQAVNTSAIALVEYDKKPSKSFLWSAQSALMEAVITQKGWYESISAL